MAGAETARLIASLELQDKNFTRGIKRVESGVTRVDKKLGAFSGFVNRNMARAIDSIGVRLIGSVGTGLEELATLEDAATSVTGAIGQVGKGWTTTADDIIAAANRIESETDAAFDDKLIVAATETLIRYGKVSEDNLVPAMEVMTDLAARTGDVDSAATLLAKALADPAKAAGKLARSGVVLTKAQQDQIKAMVEAGDVAGAQTFLLRELEKTTKGAAAASAGPYRDALNKLGDAGEDLRRGFTTALAPALIEVADLLTKELAKPSTIKTLKDIGLSVAAAVRGVVGFARGLPWETIGESLRIAGQGAKAVLDAFLGLPSWLQTAVITGWGLNKLSGGFFSSFASGLIKGVLGMNAGVVNINAAAVNGLPGAGGAVGTATKGAGVVSRVANAVKILGAVTIAGASIAALAQAFGEFQTTVTESQESLQEKVNQTTKQGFKETVANLEATSAALLNANPLQQVLASMFGGSEITQNFEAAADRIVKEQGLTRSQTITALDALKEAQKAALKENLKTPDLDAAIRELERRLRTGNTRNPENPRQGGAPGAFRPNPEQVAAARKLATNQQATTNAVKNAASIASRENSAQKAELGNVKNAVTTLTAQQKAAAVAAAATTVLQGALQAGRDALQTAAVRTGASQQTAATRGVAPPIVGTLAVGFASLRSTIWAARPPAPVIQSTTVVQRYNVTQRGGATEDSRTRGGV